MDRDYDDNKIFLKLDSFKNDYVYVSLPREKFSIITNGFLLQIFAIAEKVRSLLHEKTFIWSWSMALRNIL